MIDFRNKCALYNPNGCPLVKEEKIVFAISTFLFIIGMSYFAWDTNARNLVLKRLANLGYMNNWSSRILQWDVNFMQENLGSIKALCVSRHGLKSFHWIFFSISLVFFTDDFFIKWLYVAQGDFLSTFNQCYTQISFPQMQGSGTA